MASPLERERGDGATAPRRRHRRRRASRRVAPSTPRHKSKTNTTPNTDVPDGQRLRGLVEHGPQRVSEVRDLRLPVVPPQLAACVEINQCFGCTKSFLGDDAAVLAPSSGEEPASPRHRADVASMAWRTTRRFRTNAPLNFDFHTGNYYYATAPTARRSGALRVVASLASRTATGAAGAARLHH